MAEEKSNLPVVVIEDEQYLLDYSDITGIEWREIKKTNWSQLNGSDSSNINDGL